MKTQLALISVAVFSMITAGSAHAAVSFAYVTDTPAVQASASTPVSVNVYLQETVTGGDTSLLAAEDGLYGVGLTATRTGTLPSQPAALSAITPGAAFNGPPQLQPVTAGQAMGYWGLAIGAKDGVAATSLGGGVSRVLLGSLTVQSGAAAGTTTFSLAGYQDNTVSFVNIYDLDSSSASPAYAGASVTPGSFTVTTAVPEPVACAIGLLGMAGLMARRRR